MREMYIATHGRYAEGIVSALNLLIGDDHGVTPVCAYCGEIGSTAELATRFDAIARLAAGRTDTAQRLQDAFAAASGAMQYMNLLPEIMAARQATQHKTQDNIDDFFAGEDSL